MVMSIEWIVLSISIVWLIALTLLFLRLSSHYNNLLKGASTKTLKSVLEELLAQVHMTKKDIDSLRIRCDKIEKDNTFHIQKIGLLRFNPFKDTGGDQSFILVFVDANNTGVVMSGLYSRSGTRWYAKRVVKGEGVEHELSDEEKKAIKEAKSAL
ncbi:MAG: DUF4446 family protein, partial [Candidatus Levybacteria bacterium]|nr:DUF4446 family protein [Candidatus Levybacteria bacterium]